nr:uncharacterized protein LOC105491581 isoform X5 [Macaca nemestrina]
MRKDLKKKAQVLGATSNFGLKSDFPADSTVRTDHPDPLWLCSYEHGHHFGMHFLPLSLWPSGSHLGDVWIPFHRSQFIISGLLSVILGRQSNNHLVSTGTTVPRLLKRDFGGTSSSWIFPRPTDLGDSFHDPHFAESPVPSPGSGWLYGKILPHHDTLWCSLTTWIQVLGDHRGKRTVRAWAVCCAPQPGAWARKASTKRDEPCW